MRFKDKTIVITGAGYGIGKRVALSLGKEGGNVVLAARSREKIAAVAEELKGMGTRPLAVPTDVSSEEQVAALFNQTQAAYGGVDILINNAGIAGPTGLARDATLAEWEETLRVNLTGAFLCARAASAIMVEQGSGCMVNVTSIGGRMGYPLRSPYAASKWGMVGLSHSLAGELGPYGIRVNAVAPGPVEGERIERVIRSRAEAQGQTYEQALKFFISPMPLGRMPTEQEVTETILFLASDAASAITGQVLHVDGGFRMN